MNATNRNQQADELRARAAALIREAAEIEAREIDRQQREAAAAREAERLAKVPQIDLAKVTHVYASRTGKAHACMCGCSGTHSYSSRVKAAADASHGYAVRVSDISVRNVVAKINGAQPEERDDDKRSNPPQYACAIIDGRSYVAYFDL